MPQLRDLDAARAFAVQVFSILFDEPDVNGLFDAYINRDVPPPRTTDEDRLIDEEHGLIEVCGQMENASQVLFAIDPTRYHQIASLLREAGNR
ncbi:MAG TPA: hypothetical protein VMF91_19905 [Bryobacteraceae bacterium]|nr:hypothetical protein [Bryobacteraceae bacterium]